MLRLAGTRRRQLYSGEHLVRRQNRFSRGILLRQNEEVAGRHHALTRGADDAELRVERDQRRSRVGRVDDVAGPAAEDRVESVLAHDRKARLAAILQARKPIAEIPAPRTLADVAGQRSDVANLRRGHVFGCFGQHRVLTSNNGWLPRASSVISPPMFTPSAEGVT